LANFGLRNVGLFGWIMSASKSCCGYPPRDRALGERAGGADIISSHNIFAVVRM
jgi:hypothetical protein